MNSKSEQASTAFINLLKNPVKFRLYLLSHLPSAFFSGISLRHVDEQVCAVSVPYKWMTKNPFRSTYFACLSMAAEMSTGVLCLLHLYKRNPPVSMLVVKVESEFFKKATDQTTFLCNDGLMIKETIELAVQSGGAKMIRTKSVGTNKNGVPIAEFFVTRSFKVRSASVSRASQQSIV